MIIEKNPLQMRRFNTSQELLSYILNIAAEAMENLASDPRSFNTYRELLQCYQSSPHELSLKAKAIQQDLYWASEALVDKSTKLDTPSILSRFNGRWIQILANILYLIEPDIIVNNSKQVADAWSFLFMTYPSELNPLNITIYHK